MLDTQKILKRVLQHKELVKAAQFDKSGEQIESSLGEVYHSTSIKIESSLSNMSLEEFIKSSLHNGYVKYKTIKSYYRKGQVRVDRTIYKNALTRANTTNSKRATNIYYKEKHKSTGLYREFDDLTKKLAKQYGFEGVYVESVLNEFLGKKLESYGYVKCNEDYGTENYFFKIDQDKVESEDFDRSERDKFKGKPLQTTNSVVVVYRACRSISPSIGKNDYITLSLRFAKEHAVSNSIVNGEKYHVLKAIAQSKHVFEAMNPGEYFYDGPPLRCRSVFETDEDGEEIKSAFANEEGILCNSDGTPVIFYHQTSQENAALIKQNGFDLNKIGARGSDTDLPDGIYFKDNYNNIQVGTTNTPTQMLYNLKLKNPLYVSDRKALLAILRKNSKFDRAWKRADLLDHQIAKKIDELGDLAFRVRKPLPGSVEHNAQIDLDKFMKKASDKRIDQISAQTCRKIGTQMLKDAGYDGVIVLKDVGSFNRVVSTTIIFDPKQAVPIKEN